MIKNNKSEAELFLTYVSTYLFNLAKLPLIVWSSDPIMFSTEVKKAFANDMIVHNSLMQN